jgi:hypothetical protein
MKSAGDRSAILLGVPLVSLLVPDASVPQGSGSADRNHNLWPQATLQKQEAALLTNAKPDSFSLQVQHAPLPHVVVHPLHGHVPQVVQPWHG